MIDSRKALQRVAQELPRAPVLHDPLFSVWMEGEFGEPQLVCNLQKEPSYWVIPVEYGGRVVGFVRVLGDGRVTDYGVLYRDPQRLDGCPKVITGLEKSEALKIAQQRIDRDRFEEPSEPVYVHDGPIGREAWRIEVYQQGVPTRWIFVTPAFTYERPFGQQKPDGYE
jgi:hypothetical protein